MQDGLIDVIGFAAGVPIPTVSQLEVQTDINLIDFTDEELATIVEAFPVSPFSIPAGTYQSLTEDANSVAMWNFAIANCDLPESFVYEATRIAMEDNARMMNVHQSASETLPENWDKNNVLQVASRRGALVQRERRLDPGRHDPRRLIPSPDKTGPGR